MNAQRHRTQSKLPSLTNAICTMFCHQEATKEGAQAAFRGTRSNEFYLDPLETLRVCVLPAPEVSDLFAARILCRLH